jgi:hypothetical protein
MRPILVIALFTLSANRAAGQAGAKGVPAPADIHPFVVSDSSLIRLYNSVQVLGEKFVGIPGAQLRVIGTSGGSAELDCDCILTRVHIAVNLDGDKFRVYRLPELLDPQVASIVTEKKDGVAYIDYGPASGRRRVRVEILPATIRVLAQAQPQQPTRAVSPDSAVVLYCAAWNTDERAERARLLDRVWTPDGVYSDPNPTRAVGRAALSDSIAALRRRYPGARFHCSAPQMHHAVMRTTWIYLRPDRTEVAHGEDFYELAADGRIKRVTGFFGAAPVVKP